MHDSIMSFRDSDMSRKRRMLDFDNQDENKEKHVQKMKRVLSSVELKTRSCVVLTSLFYYLF